MRVYFDTEFIENGRTIDLLSIGLVREDGETYYAETTTAWCLKNWGPNQHNPVDAWLVENVIPHLEGKKATERREMAREILEFVGREPEFWAYYADYDWVALCQLYGRMIDLPEGWPMYCRDFKQVVDAFPSGSRRLAVQDPDVDGPEHNALSDARWLKRVADPILNPKPKCLCGIFDRVSMCDYGLCSPFCKAC